MIYVAICDDDKKAVNKLKDIVSTSLSEKNVLYDITTYTQSKMLFYDIQEKKHFDLILSDIEMPDMDGMVLAAYIKQYLPYVCIIFITSHLKYSIDAFELSIFRYIPKNMIKDRLPLALRDAIQMITMQMDEFYKIEMPSRFEKIPYKSILYIQREGKNSLIALNDGSITKVRKSLSQLFKEFKREDFVYIERGTIVNLSQIMSINEDMIKLSNGMRLRPSHTKLEEVKERLSRFWRERV